jgi:hypothetical protein
VRRGAKRDLTLLLDTVVDPLRCHDLDALPGTGGLVFISLWPQAYQMSRHILLNISTKLSSIALHDPCDPMALILAVIMRNKQRVAG